MTATPIELAKQAIDVGLMTNDVAANAETLSNLGLTYDHLLKVGGGIHQHRYTCGGSVIKLNDHRGPLQPMTTGYSRLRLATEVDAPVAATTTDGVEIVAVPPGHDGLSGIEVTWRTARPEAASGFLLALGADTDGDRYRIGESFVVIDAAASQPDTSAFEGAGFRYLTVQVRDLESAHEYMCSLGFREGRAPLRLGDVAYISFVRDADGNWIELSQRASLTGDLPEVSPDRHVR